MLSAARGAGSGAIRAIRRCESASDRDATRADDASGSLLWSRPALPMTGPGGASHGRLAPPLFGPGSGLGTGEPITGGAGACMAARQVPGARRRRGGTFRPRNAYQSASQPFAGSAKRVSLRRAASTSSLRASGKEPRVAGSVRYCRPRPCPTWARRSSGGLQQFAVRKDLRRTGARLGSPPGVELLRE